MSRLLTSLTALAVTLALTAPLSAQTSYGSIVGTVTDASNSSIPAAAVTLTNIGTAERRTSESDANGSYQFVNLVPGNYNIDVEKAGFKHFTRDQIQVQVQVDLRINVPMEIGDIGQKVEVTAQTPLLQSESAQVGQVIEGRNVTEMPLNGRNTYALIALAPGVQPQGGALTGSLNFSISGGMPNQGTTFVDGSWFMSPQLNTAALQPSQDVIQEFQVMSSDAGPEFGGTLNGVINLVTKSGTNAYHGTAYEYLRNKLLNASSFFSNKAGLPRPAYIQNQFGFTVGGPIIRNKTFFFAGYEGSRVRTQTTGSDTMPTAAQRSGDFSNLRTSSGSLIPVYDPATTACGGNGLPACASGQTVIRSLFPGNIIPASRLDPTAVIMNKYWALPNVPGAPFTGTNNFIINYPANSNANQTNIRIDQNIGDSQHLFARYTLSNPLTLPADVYGTGGTITTLRDTAYQQGVLGYTRTINPTTILTGTVSVVRDYNTRFPSNLGIDLTTIGWPAATNAEIAQKQIPEIVVPGLSPGGNRFAGLFYQSIGNVESISGNLTKILGRHTLKFGGEFNRIFSAYGQDAGNANVFTFSTAFTAQNPLTTAGTGSAYASYLLGLGSSGNMVNINLPAAEQRYSALYFGDTFRATNKLTLTFGLRWEYTGYWSERHGLDTVWLPGATNPALQAAGLNYGGDIVPVASSRYPSSLSQAPHWKLFSPRLGAAYRLGDKTAIRSGFGVFYTPGTDNQDGDPYASPINNATTAWAPTLDGGFTPYATLSNPFPTGVLPAPGRSPSYETLILGTQVISDIPHDATPYVMNWNFTVQHQFEGGFMAELAYVGERGVHLYDAGGLVDAGMGFDQLPSQYLSLGSQLLQQVPNPFHGIIQSGPLSGTTIPYGQLLLPFPQYAGVFSASTAGFDNIYHSLQARFEKRFRTAGTILASYTLQKNIGNADTMTGYNEFYQPGETQNYYNIGADRSELSYDVPQRLVVSYVMDIPIGRGKRFMGGASGVIDKLVSGWGFSGISSFQQGFPIPLLAQPTTLSTQFNAGVPRPNVTAGCAQSISGAATDRLNQWFNISCFSQPSTFGFGNVSRADSLVRTQGIDNFDLTLFKQTKINERVGLTFRAEVYNLANRVQFNPPGNQIGSSLFGVVSGQLSSPRIVQLALRCTF